MQIIVGLSGGVDSSVAALLLKDEGHDVTGVMMRRWREGRYAGGGRDACFGAGEADSVRTAEAFCRRFGLPFRTFDCAEAFEQEVVANFRAEYLAGRTPNPCVRCNALLKFGLLPELARASGLACDAFATGHYARIDQAGGRYRLLRASETARDQSYFLYRLSQEQLRRQLFPLGGMTKAEVRDHARRYGITVAEAPDSQDFYSGDHRELVGAPDQPGDIIDESGKVLGRHTGFWKFTIGQRKGLGVAHPHPLYVIRVDAGRNAVVVGPAESTRSRALVAGDCHWVSIAPPAAPLAAQIKIRSTGEPVPGATLHPREDGRIAVRMDGDGLAGVAPGQSAVFYQGDVLLGGGIIESGA